MDELAPIARIVWKLARNHTWGHPMPERDIIDIATKNEDYDEMREQLDDALDLPFLKTGPHGVYIPNGRGTHVEAANWLMQNTDLPEDKIAATLSRLPPEWPSQETNS